MDNDTNTNTARDQLAKIIDDGSSPEAADHTASRILVENVVIKRADLPEVVEKVGRLCVDDVLLAEGKTAAERRREARRFLAAAEYLDAREAREAEAAKEAELTKRRDALAAELGAMVFFDDSFRKYEELSPIAQAAINWLKYEELTPVAQAAINWLMEAQDKLAKYEEVQA